MAAEQQDRGPRPFVVYVADNGRAMDEQARYQDSAHATYAAALARCKEIVDRCLDEYGRSEAGLRLYRQFGDDPYIVGPQGNAPRFSAWSYAARRCRGGE